MRTGLGAFVALIISAAVFAQGSVNWSILPNARTGEPNEELTFLATITNSRDVTMTCQPRFGGFFTRPGGVSGRAQFFTYDGTTLGDTANAFVDIPAQSSQNYVVVMTLDRAYRGNVLVNIRCTDPDDLIHDLRRFPLVNDFQVVIENGNPPDIIMIGATLSNDGVARVGATGPRAALMTMAAVNIGSPATDFIVVPDVTGFSTLQAGYRPTICETDAAGLCIGPEDTFVRIASWPTDEVRLFAVRLRVPPQLGVPFYPDSLRLRVGAGPEPKPEPEPDTTGLGRPADLRGLEQLLDAMFGGYGSAMSASPQAPYQAAPAPVQQCSTQPDGDVGGEWARSGGILAVMPAESDDGNFTADGFLEFSDLQFGRDIARFIPVHLDAPAAGGAATMTLFGAGDGTPVPTDVEYPVTVSPPRVDGGLVIRWDAQPGGVLDFRVAGRTRCAPAPRIRFTVPGDGSSAEADEYRSPFRLNPPIEVNASPPINGSSTVVLGEGDSGGRVATATGTTLVDSLSRFGLPPEPPIEETGTSEIFDASLSVRLADEVGYTGVFVPTEFDTSGEIPTVRCGVMSYTGTIPTRDTEDNNRDGGVTIIHPIDEDPAELEDGDCVF